MSRLDGNIAVVTGGAYVLLVGDESSFSTGAEFIGDGGELAGLIRQLNGPATRTACARS